VQAKHLFCHCKNAVGILQNILGQCHFFLVVELSVAIFRFFNLKLKYHQKMKEGSETVLPTKL
jgi:hypothetical protein